MEPRRRINYRSKERRDNRISPSTAGGCPLALPANFGRRRRVIVLGLLASIVIGLSACGGTSGDASADAASSGDVTGAGTASSHLSARDLVPLLTRYGVGPQGVGVDLTYAPDAFFEITGITPLAEMDSQPTLAFFMQENTHEGELPSEPPQVLLELDGGDRVPPYSAQVTADDPHHRTTRLLFPRPNGWSTESEQTLTLVAPLKDGTVSAGNTFEWQLPIDLGTDAGESGGE